MNKKINIYSDNIGFVEYVSHMGSDLTIVNSARVSFGKHKEKLDTKDKKLINYLIKHQHTSTLEHNLVTMRFKVPLFVRSQHHRHRTWSYNEISRRYTDYCLEFYEPEKFRTQHKSNRQSSNIKDLIDPQIDMYHPACSKPISWPASKIIKNHVKDSVDIFDKLLSQGVCREQARMILPQNLYTEYYGTCNLNNLLKFISLRTHAGAQWEIQKVAEGCLEIITDLWPITVNAYRLQAGEIVSGDTVPPIKKG